MSRTTVHAAVRSARSQAYRRLLRAGLAGMLVLAMSGARADTYPAHGAFQVRSGIDSDRVRFCQLRAEAKLDGVAFALTLR